MANSTLKSSTFTSLLLPLLLLILLTANLSYAEKKALSNDTNITVYTAGDIVDCRSKKLASYSIATAKIVDEGIAQNPNAIVLTLGDHTYPIGRQEEFDTCYEPSWGKFKDRTYPIPGNHEYYIPSAYTYFQYFGSKASSQQRPYYSFNKGNWHFIALDSNLKNEQQEAQLDWLKQDLKNNRSTCTLAYWHHPLYSSGLHGNNSIMQAAWNILMEAKADLVLSGHDHDYERFASQNSQGEKDEQAGMRSFIVGTGGAEQNPVLWQKQHSEVLKTHVYGVLKLTLKKQSYDWQFLSIAGSTFTDEGSGTCHSK